MRQSLLLCVGIGFETALGWGQVDAAISTTEPVALPFYEASLAAAKNAPAPSAAQPYLPILRETFSAHGLPEALVWIAETESSFNPEARSSEGAVGLFQLMPATAKALGLSLFPVDERTNPQRNAQAAARLLVRLHERFRSWPLVFAAYHAGEGRIATTLEEQKATTFTEIDEHLPVETRQYVAKIAATLLVRAGTTPDTLPAPTLSPRTP